MSFTKSWNNRLQGESAECTFDLLVHLRSWDGDIDPLQCGASVGDANSVFYGRCGAHGGPYFSSDSIVKSSRV